MVGMIYERYHTRQIADLGGLGRQATPCWRSSCCSSRLSSIGLPGLNGFAGEFLLLLGMFQRAGRTVAAGGGWQLQGDCGAGRVRRGAGGLVHAVAGPAGLLWAAESSHPAGSDHHGVRDLTFRELAAITPLAVFVLWIGIQPKFFLDRMAPSLNAIVAGVQKSWELESPGSQVADRDQSRYRGRFHDCHDTVSYDTIHQLIPEILLVITASWIFVTGAFDTPRRGGVWYAVSGWCCRLCVVHRIGSGSGVVATGGDRCGLRSRVFDLFGYALRCLAVGLGLLLVALARAEEARPSAEVLGSLILVVAGLMLVAAARDLIILFLGLELISIPTYVLLIHGRHADEASEEATVKYFMLSVLSSALLLYGFSFLYGLAGSTRLDVITFGCGTAGRRYFQRVTGNVGAGVGNSATSRAAPKVMTSSRVEPRKSVKEAENRAAIKPTTGRWT